MAIVKNPFITDVKNLVKVSVEQLANKNQFVINCKINDNRAICFQSYQTLIAVYYPANKIMFVNYHYWDYSKTTSKHFKMFVNEYTHYRYESRLEWLKTMENDPSLGWFEDLD